MGVALGRRAGVDAVGVALGGRWGRSPALPGGFHQILQRNGTGLKEGNMVDSLVCLSREKC